MSKAAKPTSETLTVALTKQREALLRLRELLLQLLEQERIAMSTIEAAQDTVREALFDPELD